MISNEYCVSFLMEAVVLQMIANDTNSHQMADELFYAHLKNEVLRR